MSNSTLSHCSTSCKCCTLTSGLSELVLVLWLSPTDSAFPGFLLWSRYLHWVIFQFCNLQRRLKVAAKRMRTWRILGSSLTRDLYVYTTYIQHSWCIYNKYLAKRPFPNMKYAPSITVESAWIHLKFTFPFSCEHQVDTSWQLPSFNVCHHLECTKKWIIWLKK